MIGSLALSLAIAILGPARPSPDKSPVKLFNGQSLEGWYVFIPHQDNSDPYKDPKGVFKVEDGAIHVSGEEFGCLTTEKEYQDYRLIVEFRWGEKRYPPRETARRDSGILLHCSGPDKVWTKSIECQIQEGDCGDFWLVSGTSLVIDGKVEKNMRKKSKDGEKPFGEWNTVEVVCQNKTIKNYVNGVLVNEGVDASVSKGKILLQSEGAEVFYRKVELIPILHAPK